MTTYPDTRGMTNLEYRKARGTLQASTATPDQLQEAWDEIRQGRRQATQADARREAKLEKAKRIKGPKKKHKSRRVRERKKVARDGSLRVCSTEPKRRQNRRTPACNRAAGAGLAETADLDWEDQL